MDVGAFGIFGWVCVTFESATSGPRKGRVAFGYLDARMTIERKNFTQSTIPIIHTLTKKLKK